jgi:chromosome segregation ATPase
MAISIKKIQARDLGPLKSFDHEFKLINLIYSKNEGGKSFLVEFIIRCLFKNRNSWGYLRDISGSGRIIMEGLEDKETTFTSSSNIKLENYIEKELKGLSPSIMKLLIIKGGETDIVNTQAGIDKGTLKEILSSKRILDEIDNKISETIKNADLANLPDGIYSRGEGKVYKDLIKKYQDVCSAIDEAALYDSADLIELKLKETELLKQQELLRKAKRHQAYLLANKIELLKQEQQKIESADIQNIERLFNEYNSVKSACNELKDKLKSIDGSIEAFADVETNYENQLKAKKFKAYTISQKIKQLENLPLIALEGDLKNLEQNINKYFEKVAERNQTKKQVENLEKGTEHYSWLQGTRDIYYKLFNKKKEIKPTNFLPYIILLLLFAGGIVIFFAFSKTAGLLISAISFIVMFIYSLLQTGKSTNISTDEEYKKIEAEFKNRFNGEFTIDKIEELLNQLSPKIGTLNTNKDRLTSLEVELNAIKTIIIQQFQKLTSLVPDEDKWNSVISNLWEERKKFLKELEDCRTALAKLNIDESDYLTVDPGLTYSQSDFENYKDKKIKLEELRNQRKALTDEISAKIEKLQETGNKIKEKIFAFQQKELDEKDWKNAIDDIKKQREEVSNELSRTMAEFEGLGIAENEFYKDETGLNYSLNAWNQLESDLSSLRSEIAEKDKNLSMVKQKLCILTGDDISIEWNGLIEKLYDLKDTVFSQLKDIEAKIIAGNIVHNTIMQLQTEEDEKITEGVNSEDLKNLLFEMTGKYHSLTIQENEIKILDNYLDYKLKDVSTGTREQVMLALRMSFARRIFKQRSAFLIFDDAFQHSDYVRRPRIIKSLINMAIKDKWQIIYFTMDEHIKNEFLRQAGTIQDFQWMEL